MESYESRLGLNPIWLLSYKKWKIWTQVQREECHLTMKAETKKGPGRTLPRVFRGIMVFLTTWFQTSGFPNCDRINLLNLLKWANVHTKVSPSCTTNQGLSHIGTRMKLEILLNCKPHGTNHMYLLLYRDNRSFPHREQGTEP